MILARTHDMALVASIMSHPLVWAHLHEDGTDEPNPQDAESLHWMLVEDDGEPAGVFLAYARSAVCYEMHTCLLPRIWGEKSKQAARLLGDYLFYEVGCEKIISNVPAYNRRALKFAIDVGSKNEGCNRASYLHKGKLEDQIMFGITKEEWSSCH